MGAKRPLIITICFLSSTRLPLTATDFNAATDATSCCLLSACRLISWATASSRACCASGRKAGGDFNFAASSSRFLPSLSAFSHSLSHSTAAFDCLATCSSISAMAFETTVSCTALSREAYSWGSDCNCSIRCLASLGVRITLRRCTSTVSKNSRRCLHRSRESCSSTAPSESSNKFK